MPPRKVGSQRKETNPIVAEFQQCCKVVGFQDEEVINLVISWLSRSENQIRLVNVNLTPVLCKALLRLFQRSQKVQQVTLYACPVQDEAAFFKQLANDFSKCPSNALALDFMPIQRESVIPLLSNPSLEIFSLRGNPCLSSYDFETHEQRPFPTSLNAFFNALSVSNVKVLNLYGCNIGDDGAVALANTLFFNQTLACVCLSKNKIGDRGAEALAGALSKYVLDEQETAIVEKLTNDESKQKISDEGGGLVKRKGRRPPPKKAPSKTTRGRAQARHQVERQMNFDPAAPVMAAVLGKWGTCITLESGQKVIPGNTTLTSLFLDENMIGEKGARFLRDMLMENSKLVQFSVANNPEISNDTAESMTRKLPVPTETQT